MLDKYVYGTCTRTSPEAPISILDYTQAHTKLGGAANVALNLAALGSNVHLIGLTGKDLEAKELEDLVKDNHAISSHQLLKDENRFTTVKTRFIAEANHLLRLDKENTTPITQTQSAEFFEVIKSVIISEKIQLIVLEDYDKGFLTESLISGIICYAKSLNIAVCVDPKFKPISVYKGATIFKPNLRELNKALNSNHKKDEISKIIDASKQIIEFNNFDQMWVTLGSNGMVFNGKNHHSLHFESEDIQVSDVCGAGDAVIALLSLGYAHKIPPEVLGKIANIAGGLVCKNVGVFSISIEALKQEINKNQQILT